MTGSDLIVLAPWIAFGLVLAVVYILLLRSRRASRRQARPFSAAAGAGRTPAGREPACYANPKESRCPQTNGDGRPT